MTMSLKERKISLNPRVKLNHNMYIKVAEHGFAGGQR